MAPITLPAGSRSAEALRVVGITSPLALRGLSRALRVTPRSTTSLRAAMNSLVSSGLMKRESDCSFAEQTGVDKSTITNWEKQRTQPEIRYIPGIIALLGYCPIITAKSLPAKLRAPIVLALGSRRGRWLAYLG